VQRFTGPLGNVKVDTKIAGLPQLEIKDRQWLNLGIDDWARDVVSRFLGDGDKRGVVTVLVFFKSQRSSFSPRAPRK
jgi:hypothetical protein